MGTGASRVEANRANSRHSKSGGTDAPGIANRKRESMKANAFLTLISIVLAGLFGYWVYSVAEGKEQDILCGICSTICFLSTVIPIVGFKYESGRMGVNVRILSGLFFIAFLISHFLFAYYGVKMPLYIILNGILLVFFLAIYYKLQEIKDF